MGGVAVNFEEIANCPGYGGELFGYGYLPLPLAEKKATTGDQCWTLFVNSRTFKGPVAFFTPYFWSRSAEVHPEFAGASA